MTTERRTPDPIPGAMKLSERHLNMLRGCRLWDGSTLQQSHQVGMLEREQIVQRFTTLSRLDDRTLNETRFMRVLGQILVETA